MHQYEGTAAAEGARRTVAAWAALEALSPLTYKDPIELANGERHRLAKLGETFELPWDRVERVPPDTRLWYQVVIGAIQLDRAANLVERTAAEEHDAAPVEAERAVMAAALLDSDGIVVADGVAVSSCAWALPLALTGRFGDLLDWPKAERTVVEGLNQEIRRFDDDGQAIPLDWTTLRSAYDWLVGKLQLPADLVEPPSIAVRVYRRRDAKDPPEAMLLNSFFLGDLASAADRLARGEAPATLLGYLGLSEAGSPVNLLADSSALEDAVAPAKISAAAWPSGRGRPLVLLQQAAVNLARVELASREGLLAINGPPGTGKTTLLRDVIASCILDRADAMVAFDDPSTAFPRTGHRLTVGLRGATIELHQVHASLKGHEVLVASSNNKAVENISKELPAASAIGTKGLRYFKSISDRLQAATSMESDDGDAGAAPDPIDTWGMIAAVLGNSPNRKRFRENFWWDKDYSLQNYLRAASGQSVLRSFDDEGSGRMLERPPRIIAEENAPADRATALVRWNHARQQYAALRRTIDDDLGELEAIRTQCREQVAAESAFQHRQNAVLGPHRVHLDELAVERARHEQHVEVASADHQSCAAAAAPHLAVRPSIWQRLTSTHHARLWRRRYRPIAMRVARAAKTVRAAQDALARIQKVTNRAERALTEAEASLALDRFELDRRAAALRPHQARLGAAMADAAFFAQEHASLHIATPWIPAELQRKREALFAAALAVHKAFIDAAAEPILHNLGILLDAFGGRAPTDPHRARLLPDLWSTLFMVVPVVSTTFASVERMLAGLPAACLGWLLIDEAGQALPQAAVGALSRAKRAIIVGDPMQIQPVVTLPDRWVGEICNFFGIDRGAWAAPEASVQTLADRASRFQAEFNASPVPRRVGIPLLVHRRCDEPMFSIANRIAYDGQMVRPQEGAPASTVVDAPSIAAVLGPSVWWDIDGSSDGNFCKEEGLFMIECLRRLADAGVSKPDLFIISPFRRVVVGIKELLNAEGNLLARLGLERHAWLKDRVGTIHTAQGREAAAIILVLGAPTPERAGARTWATSTPNILNVAVSRAKHRL